MNVKILGALGALALLAACSSDEASNAAATGAGGSGGVVGAAGSVRPGSQEDLVANVGDRVFFETDSSQVQGEGRSTLERQSAWLNRYPQVQVYVEGHADERGTREYNIALGARRATNTKNYLVSRGIAPNRIRTISYGKERPVAVCNDISCWSQNRRAVTVLNNAGS